MNEANKVSGYLMEAWPDLRKGGKDGHQFCSTTPLSKRWCLLPLLLELGWPETCSDQQNAVGGTLGQSCAWTSEAGSSGSLSSAALFPHQIKFNYPAGERDPAVSSPSPLPPARQGIRYVNRPAEPLPGPGLGGGWLRQR